MTKAIHIPRFQYVVMETMVETDGPQPVAGFMNEVDASEYIRVFEASEGYRPRIYEYEALNDEYHEEDINNYV